MRLARAQKEGYLKRYRVLMALLYARCTDKASTHLTSGPQGVALGSPTYLQCPDSSSRAKYRRPSRKKTSPSTSSPSSEAYGQCAFVYVNEDSCRRRYDQLWCFLHFKNFVKRRKPEHATDWKSREQALSRSTTQMTVPEPEMYAMFPEEKFRCLRRLAVVQENLIR